MNKLKYLLAVLFAFTLFSCTKNYTPEQKKYIAEIEQQRKEKDDFMKNDPDSPFNRDPNAHFQDLKYYDVNPDYVFKSKLYEYKNKDTVKIFGTKGEERKAVRYGYVKINFKQGERDVNVYKSTSKNGETYYSIWFTDQTTGDETYGVGRYLDFDFKPDSNFIYTVDFNLAYNPYCSYSAIYSCAIPTKEDHIDVAIKAGEKRFH
ncbi:MAG: DUF1684 domain-containing protein [Ignavibacteriaceae bacterium]